MSKKKEEKVIDSIRVYQAVTFEKASETFFSTRIVNNKIGREISVNLELGGVEIKSAKDHILVPFTNVSCIYFKSPIKLEQEKKQQEEKERLMSNTKTQRDTAKRPL